MKVLHITNEFTKKNFSISSLIIYISSYLNNNYKVNYSILTSYLEKNLFKIIFKIEKRIRNSSNILGKSYRLALYPLYFFTKWRFFLQGFNDVIFNYQKYELPRELYLGNLYHV